MNNPEEENSNANSGDTKEKEEFDGFVVRIRGLPWSASKDDIVKFFTEADIKSGPQGIHLTMSREGRPSGEAYIEFTNEEDVKKALAKDNEHLGSRYIEVFRSSDTEMEWALRKCGLDGEEAFGDACVRLRGLPFGCSKEEIAQFFTGLEIVRNGITLPIDDQGRSTGEAYVQFSSQEIAEKAMGKHKEKIGHRYIEIFKSSLQEIRSASMGGPMRMGGMRGSNRMNPYDRMDRPSMFGGGRGGGFGGRGGRGFGGKSRFDEDFGDDDFVPTGRFSIPSGRGGGRMGGGDRFFGRGGGRGEAPGTGHRVHMRGLPYRATERDIYEFFSPLNPANIRITNGPGGRPSGEADVEFSSHEEAVKAMKRDKDKIQHRYIELFLHSEPEPFRRGGAGGFNNMGGGFPAEEGGFGGGGFGNGGGGAGRSFMSEERSFGSGGPGMERGFGARGGGADRGFGAGGGRGFGSGSGGDGYGFSGGDRAGFGSSVDRPFNQGAGGDRYGGGGGMGQGRGMNMPADRSFGGGMGSGDFRNGNGGGGMSGGYRDNSFGQDAPIKDESEFYGSGKLFGESNFNQPMSQGMGMMGGGNNYTSF